jgi:acyl carrier protein
MGDAKLRTKRSRGARRGAVPRSITAGPPPASGSASARAEPRPPKPDERLTRSQIRAKVTAILRRFVPDFDPKALKPDTSLRQALAADSMDVLNLVVAIHHELGVDIPEADYGKIDTLDNCLDYLATAIATQESGRRSTPAD